MQSPSEVIDFLMDWWERKNYNALVGSNAERVIGRNTSSVTEGITSATKCAMNVERMIKVSGLNSIRVLEFIFTLNKK